MVAAFLEGRPDIRHPVGMSLQAIRHFSTICIRRPLGQLAGGLLLVSLLASGAPIGKIHSHADAYHDHDHGSLIVANGLFDREFDDQPAASESEEDETLHVHGLCATASALPALTELALGEVAPVAPVFRITAPPPPSSAQAPPHRPPIV